MKKVLFIIAIFIATGISAQTKYQKGMQKAFDLWNQNKLTEASQLFERISKAEPENWLPAYYAATVEIISSFGIKNETVLTAKLTKAQEFLDAAKSNSENNPELIITQALLNLGYIAFDGQKYGMTLSGKNNMLYAKALELAPNNPRVILGKAEWEMGAAKFFGKSTAPYCDAIKKAIELGKAEKVEQEFYPKFQLKRAEEVLQKCQG
ncbi:tetratricopeptide repeat protein [Polaribacter sp. Asnod6-C07]|uniref:tetratricopeptide repeat protein n=1 Tax=Polaribacter sp. Asnod6-C07 TaxID=3160582 RepID=UPI0038647535